MEKEYKPQLGRTIHPHERVDEEGDSIGARFPLHSLVDSKNHQADWYPGIITRCHPNGTYNIRYEDGSDVQFVEPEEVRFRLRIEISILIQFYSIMVLVISAGIPL